MKRVQVWWLIASVSLLLFIGTAIGLSYDLFQSFDETVIQLLQQFESPLMTAIFLTFTQIGSLIGTLIIFLILLYLFRRFRWRAESILLTSVVLATPILNIILKELFQRARPTANQLIDISGYSFPSGHTMYAASLYGITLTLIWFKLKRRSERIFLTFVILATITIIAASRIYLGVHYPSDIIGGIFASTFIISLTFYLYITERKRTRRS